MSKRDLAKGSKPRSDAASGPLAAKRVDALAPGERMATKDRVTLVIAALGLAIGVMNSVIVASNYFTTAGTSERTTQLEAERDLDAACDGNVSLRAARRFRAARRLLSPMIVG
jgi:hypothetical protein